MENCKNDFHDSRISLERFKDQLDKSKVKTVYNEQYGIKIWNNLWYQPR